MGSSESPLQKSSLLAITLSTGLVLALWASSANAFPAQTDPDCNYVVGHGDYNTGYQPYEEDPQIGALPASPATLFVPSGLEYDAVDQRLFVADLHNSRILIFDLSEGAANNMSAVAVLGQPSFTEGYSGPGFMYGDQQNTPNPAFNCAAGVNACGATRLYDISYDSVRDLLFAVDADNNRVLVWDLSSGITNGMAATAVLGQQDFVTSAENTACDGASAGTPNACGLRLPVAVSVDEMGGQLIVSDSRNHRLLVFDISAGVATGMAASYVLGQPTFTTRTRHLACDGVTANSVDACGLDSPHKATQLPGTQRFFVSDVEASRIVVYDLTPPIVNGMPAVDVVGQPDFFTGSPNTSCDGLSGGEENTNACGLGIWDVSVAFDVDRGISYIADSANHRVLVHNDLNPSNGRPADYVIGHEGFGEGYAGGAPSWGGDTNRSSVMGAADLVYDTTMDRLFVADGGNHRVLTFGANVDGVPINVGGSLLSMSSSRNLTTQATSVHMETSIGDVYDVVFPANTQPEVVGGEISILLANPDKTGWDLPTIDVDAKLPVGATKTIQISAGQFASICILDHAEFEFVSGSLCDFDGHPHSYALPLAGECMTSLTHGDIGDNPDDALDPEGLHAIEICLATDLSSITVSGLRHTGMQLERHSSSKVGAGFENGEDTSSSVPSTSAGCNAGGSHHTTIVLVVGFLMLLGWRRRSRREASDSRQ